MSKWIDPVRWFDALGACTKCGKPAHGKLMGSLNESFGPFCTKCAEARLKKAYAERAKAELKHLASVGDK